MKLTLSCALKVVSFQGKESSERGFFLSKIQSYTWVTLNPCSLFDIYCSPPPPPTLTPDRCSFLTDVVNGCNPFEREGKGKFLCNLSELMFILFLCRYVWWLRTIWLPKRARHLWWSFNSKSYITSNKSCENFKIEYESTWMLQYWVVYLELCNV